MTTIFRQDRLKNIMQENVVTQQWVAEKLGKTQSLVSSWLRGEKTPVIYDVARIARLFRVSADFLVGLTNNPYPRDFDLAEDPDFQQLFKSYQGMKKLLDEDKEDIRRILRMADEIIEKRIKPL
jgi:transcriptional regulator with XRE-family HTH domain